jgi:hypothetical protein
MHIEFAQLKLGQVRIEKNGKAVDHIRPDCSNIFSHHKSQIHISALYENKGKALNSDNFCCVFLFFSLFPYSLILSSLFVLNLLRIFNKDMSASIRLNKLER